MMAFNDCVLELTALFSVRYLVVDFGVNVSGLNVQCCRGRLILCCYRRQRLFGFVGFLPPNYQYKNRTMVVCTGLGEFSTRNHHQKLGIISLDMVFRGNCGSGGGALLGASFSYLAKASWLSSKFLISPAPAIAASKQRFRRGSYWWSVEMSAKDTRLLAKPHHQELEQGEIY